MDNFNYDNIIELFLFKTLIIIDIVHDKLYLHVFDMYLLSTFYKWTGR